jgi:hypothetical protein
MLNRTVVATLAALLLLSCSPSWSADLTRPLAKGILSKTKAFTSTYNQLSWLPNGYQEFNAEGGLTNPEFAKVVAASDGWSPTLTVKTPLTISVDEITGIAEGPQQGMKEVFFRWSMTSVSDVLRPLVIVGGTGEVIMRLYDDGWRVESGPNLTNDATPRTSTAAQQRQMEAFREGVRNRQKAKDDSLQDALNRARVVLGQPGETTTVVAPADGNWVKVAQAVAGHFNVSPTARIYMRTENGDEILAIPGMKRKLMKPQLWLALRSASAEPVEVKVTFEQQPGR